MARPRPARVLLTVACTALGLAAPAEAQWLRFPGIAQARDEAEQLVVMMEARVAGVERFGAGIIFGVSDDALYIVTADHVVRQGGQVVHEATDITVRLKSSPDRPLPATLLPDRNTRLDLAVLKIDLLKSGRIETEVIAFDRVADAKQLKPGQLLHSLGYPNRREWRMNVQPDTLAAVRQDRVEYRVERHRHRSLWWRTAQQSL